MTLSHSSFLFFLLPLRLTQKSLPSNVFLCLFSFFLFFVFIAYSLTILDSFILSSQCLLSLSLHCSIDFHLPWTLNSNLFFFHKSRLQNVFLTLSLSPQRFRQAKRNRQINTIVVFVCSFQFSFDTFGGNSLPKWLTYTKQNKSICFTQSGSC